MKLPFGIEISFNRSRKDRAKALSPVDNRGGWWPIVREFATGAWQTNTTVSIEDGLQYWAVFRCISLIAGDMAKMRVKLVEQRGLGAIWTEIELPGVSELLATPNHYQNRIQFFANWMESKLSRGNAYILKRRDPATGAIVALYVLNPDRTRPMVDEIGRIFYELNRDDLVGLAGPRILVPASEIIHDRWNTLYHPLVGLSPIYAAGINALAALRIEQNSARLFQNGANPGGVLEAPGAITEATANRLKEYWDTNFTGQNAGKVAVLGDGLKFSPMALTAVDAQLIEQLKWNDAVIAGCYGVPAHMINAGTAPAYNNVEALNQQYYSQALQVHVEAIELLLDQGLELPQKRGVTRGTEFDLDVLLRMDTATLVKTAREGVAGGILKPDEARAKLGYGPTPGGDQVYLQQQNYSLAALAKRDAKDDPFAPGANAPEPEAPADEADNDNEEAAEEAAKGLRVIEEGLAA